MTQRLTIGDAPELEYIFPKNNPRFSKIFRGFHSSPMKWGSLCNSLDRTKAWSQSGFEDDENGWYGTKTLSEAVNLASTGWEDGTKTVERVLGRIKAEHPFQLRPKRYGIAGSHPDVPRAISGNPLNMHVPDRALVSRRKTITLLSNMGAHCGFGPTEMCNRAAVVAAIVDAIEANGYACDIITYYIGNEYYENEPGQMRGLNCLSACYIKRSHQPIDLPRLAFGLGHPAMFRRFTFIDKTSNQFNADLGGGLGYSRDLKQCCLNMDDLKEKNIFDIAKVKEKIFKTEELAMTQGLEYIINDLKQQGFPLYIR